MTGEEIKAAFAAMPAYARTRFLSHLAHALTVAARDCYPIPDTPSDWDANRAFEQLRGLNEAQHRVIAALGHILDGHDESVSDGWFIDAAIGWAATGGCGTQLNWALNRAADVMEREDMVVTAQP